MEIVLTQFIVDNPFQVRSDYGDIAELADRIEAHFESFSETRGLMQVPIGRLVYPDGNPLSVADWARDWSSDQVRIQLAFGHRRLRAFRHLVDRDPARFDGMPVNLVELTDEQMLDAVWSENRERKDISAVEEAELLQRKLAQIEGGGGSQREVAELWGISRPTVSNRLRLLELPHELQAANRDGRLSERQLLALAPVVKLMQVARKAKWNEQPDSQGWKGPGSPEWFIGHVLDAPDTTSDEIREYVKLAQQHAGIELPQEVAEVELDVAGVCQPLCKGCPMRMNQFCFEKACFGRKVIAFGDRAAGLMSAELGVPAGMLVEPKGEKSYEYRTRVFKLVQAGLTENLVLGWDTNGNGARAAADWSWDKSRFEKDGRYAVFYGHKDGKVSDEEFERARMLLAESVEEPVEEKEGGRVPSGKQFNAWAEQERLLCDGMRVEMYQELVDRTAELSGEFVQMQPLLAMLMHASFDDFLNIKDAGDTLRAIANKAWDGAYLKNADAVKLDETAIRMGIHLDDGVIVLSGLLRSLSTFYRDTWGGKRTAERLLRAAARWEEFEDTGALAGLPDQGEAVLLWLPLAVEAAESVLRAEESADEEE